MTSDTSFYVYESQKRYSMFVMNLISDVETSVCRGNMRCLPAFYVIGVAKSGTSNLHQLMTQHPHIDAGKYKEIFYLERHCGRGKCLSN